MPARKSSKQRERFSSSDKIFSFVLFLMLTVGAINIYIYLSKKPATVTIDTTANDHAFWNQIITENPTYRDGYIVLYELERENGDKREQEKLIGKAINIDPFVDEGDFGKQVLSASDEK